MRILQAVAQADATVADDERHVLDAVADRTGARAEAPKAIDVDRELSRLSSDAIKRLTMRAALAIATIDGKCTTDEHRLLAKLVAAIGGDVDLAEAEAEWGSRMATMRSAVADTTDGFLRDVGRASSTGELSSQRYEALLGDFERAKKNLLARALSSTRPRET